MSLSVFLLGGGGEKPEKASKKGKQKAAAIALDDGLDALFKSSVVIDPSLSESAAAAVSASSKAAKRKRKDADDETQPAATSASSTKKAKKTKTGSAVTPIIPVPEPSHALTSSPAKTKKAKSKRAADPVPPMSVNSEAAVGPSVSSTSTAKFTPTTHEDVLSNDEAEDGNPPTLVHESVSGNYLSSASSRQQKYTPEGETSAQRDERTIFVGNIPLEVTKNRPMQKQLKRHILSFVPGAKIESVRFRSIAFQSPTSKLPDDEGAAASKKKPADKDGRQHDKERAASWRAVQDKDEVTLAQDAKKFLSAEAKKKIAFIKGELHTSAQTANAYIVFAHGRPHTSGPDDGGSDAEESAAAGTSTTQTDPYKAARAAIRDANGSVFLERTIRVDRVAGKAAIADDADPKRTVFVGNLDFASQEEDLRVFFEGVVSTERGPPPTSDDADEDEEGAGKKAVSWVAHVRIVRDKDTQLGKGFAYVQFVDTACVDEVVNMEDTKLKFAKRKLRVQRCKTLPGGGKVVSAKPPPRPPAVPAKAAPRLQGERPPRTPVPKGDPTLGARLASLSKEERKQAKAADADRIARRAAKKKARMALTAKAGGAEDRMRVRKRLNGPKGTGGARKEVKKKVGQKKKAAK